MNDEQQALFDELTSLQGKLCTMIIGNPSLSQRQAYYAAGGKAKSDDVADASASEILANPKVKAFMDCMKAQVVSDAIMSREEMLARLSLFARKGVKDIVRFETSQIGMNMETGEPVLQTGWFIPDDVPEENLAIIESLEGGKSAPKIKTYSAIQAMAQIAKLQGYEAAQKVDNTHRIVDDGSNEW